MKNLKKRYVLFLIVLAVSAVIILGCLKGNVVLDNTGSLDVRTDKNDEKIGFSGVDWVITEDFSYKIGSKFVSGTGIFYTVISEEINENSGRTRIILVSETGEKRMISNLPAFNLDETANITYYDIYNYVNNSAYIEYMG